MLHISPKDSETSFRVSFNEFNAEICVKIAFHFWQNSSKFCFTSESKSRSVFASEFNIESWIRSRTNKIRRIDCKYVDPRRVLKTESLDLDRISELKKTALNSSKMICAWDKQLLQTCIKGLVSIWNWFLLRIQKIIISNLPIFARIRWHFLTQFVD